MIQPAELSMLRRAVAFNQDLGTPLVAPSTSPEWEAVQAIDRSRRGDRPLQPRPVVKLA